MIGRRLGSHGAAPAHASRFVPAPQGTVFVPACAPSSTGCLRLRPRRLRSHQSKFHRAQGRGGPRHLIWTSQQPRWPADRHRSARRRQNGLATSSLQRPRRPEGPTRLTRPDLTLSRSLPRGRGHSTRRGALSSGRGHPARTGAGIRSPYARHAPGRGKCPRRRLLRAAALTQGGAGQVVLIETGDVELARGEAGGREPVQEGTVLRWLHGVQFIGVARSEAVTRVRERL